MKRALKHIFCITTTIWFFLIFCEIIQSAESFSLSNAYNILISHIFELPVIAMEVAMYYVMFVVIGTGIVGTIFILGASIILTALFGSVLVEAGLIGNIITLILGLPVIPLMHVAQIIGIETYVIFGIVLSLYYIIFCVFGYLDHLQKTDSEK